MLVVADVRPLKNGQRTDLSLPKNKHQDDESSCSRSCIFLHSELQLQHSIGSVSILRAKVADEKRFSTSDPKTRDQRRRTDHGGGATAVGPTAFASVSTDAYNENGCPAGEKMLESSMDAFAFAVVQHVCVRMGGTTDATNRTFLLPITAFTAINTSSGYVTVVYGTPSHKGRK